MDELAYKRIVKHGWTIIPIFFIIILGIDIIRGIYFDNIFDWFKHEGNQVMFYKWGGFLASLLTISFWIQIFNGKKFRWFIFGFTILWLITFLLGPVYEFSAGIIPIYIFIIAYIHNIVVAVTAFFSYKWAKASK